MKYVIVITLAFLAFSCNQQQANTTDEAMMALQAEVDSLRQAASIQAGKPKESIATFLTFQNNDAEEAMNFYISLFPNSKVIQIQRHPAGGPAKEGSIFYATFELNGSLFACSDSYIKHEWGFTPGVSNFVTCTSEEQLQQFYEQLSAGGQTMMPIDNYGFSTQFAFVEDRFGISWQLNLD